MGFSKTIKYSQIRRIPDASAKKGQTKKKNSPVANKTVDLKKMIIKVLKGFPVFSFKINQIIK